MIEVVGCGAGGGGVFLRLGERRNWRFYGISPGIGGGLARWRCVGAFGRASGGGRTGLVGKSSLGSDRVLKGEIFEQ